MNGIPGLFTFEIDRFLLWFAWTMIPIGGHLYMRNILICILLTIPKEIKRAFGQFSVNWSLKYKCHSLVQLYFHSDLPLKGAQIKDL